MYKSYLIVVLAAMFSACGANQDKEALQEEDREAKEKLQGIWLDDNTEAAVLQVAGDTIYYADAAVAPVAFKIIGDTLTTYGARINNYKIEKQGEYIFWFHSLVGDVIRLHRAENNADSLSFIHEQEVPVYTEVIKKDSVVMYDNTRYRGYVYINPSRIKVMRPGVSEEGLSVDNVYYDNIIHICVYEGKRSLFASTPIKSISERIAHFKKSSGMTCLNICLVISFANKLRRYRIIIQAIASAFCKQAL